MVELREYMGNSELRSAHAVVTERGKPTVLIVENSMNTTGAFNTIFSYVHYAQLSYQFIFILPEKSRLVDKVKQAGFPIETLPFREINKNPVNFFLYLPVLFINALRLNGMIRKHRVSIVHVNDFYNLVGGVARMFGGQFALFTHVRFMPNRFPRLLVSSWMKLNLAYSEYVICVSQAVKNCLTDHPKLLVIYDGLGREAPDVINRNETKNETTHLLYLAHYIPGKGQNLALEAFGRAYKRNPKLKLRFVGGDMGLPKNQQYRARLISRADELGITHAVTFDGPASDVSETFAQADIALNFSESESFSMTCLEALACGVPLITTDCGGPAELFEHGKSGYLIPNRDVEAGAKAILLLSNDSEMRTRFSKNSVRYVRRKFSNENTFKKLADIYAETLPY